LKNGKKCRKYNEKNANKSLQATAIAKSSKDNSLILLLDAESVINEANTVAT